MLISFTDLESPKYNALSMLNYFGLPTLSCVKFTDFNLQVFKSIRKIAPDGFGIRTNHIDKNKSQMNLPFLFNARERQDLDIFFARYPNYIYLAQPNIYAIGNGVIYNNGIDFICEYNDTEGISCRDIYVYPGLKIYKFRFADDVPLPVRRAAGFIRKLHDKYVEFSVLKNNKLIFWEIRKDW